MASARPWWAIVVGGMLVVLVLGLGLACGEDWAKEDVTNAGGTCTLPAGLVTTTPDATTTLEVTTTLAEITTLPADVDITAMLVGVWDCIDMPGDYTIEFKADGTGRTYQEGEIGDIFTGFSYETEGYLVTLYYMDDMMQTLELSPDGSILSEAEPYGSFSFRRQ